MHKVCKTFSHLRLDRSCLLLSFSVRLIAKPARNASERGDAGVPSDGLSDSQLRTLLLECKNDVCGVCVGLIEPARNGLVVSTVLHNSTCSYHIREDEVECPSRYFIVVS